MGLKSKLEVIPIKNLIPHEKVIPSTVEELKEKIREDGVFTDPIIVTGLSDGKYLIMDGMHRYKAIQELGAKCLPCFKVNYDSVEIKRWIRSLEGKISKEKYSKLNFKKRSGDLYQVKNGVEGFENTKKLGEKLERSFEYNPNPVEDKTNIIPPELSPKEIKKAAKQGKKFPPKSTRHVLEQRIIGVDLPLKCLFDINEAKEMLREKLVESKLKFLGGKKTIEGRFYEEKEVYRLKSKENKK